MELLLDYDYVAIFDADFKPDPDFLVRMLPTSCKLEAACMHARPALPCCSAYLAVHTHAQDAATCQAKGMHHCSTSKSHCEA
jgi:cellulose synthase/poly-beta-1,6-N-acetylglucosamine synthase-like glycosyltransferase